LIIIALCSLYHLLNTYNDRQKDRQTDRKTDRQLTYIIWRAVSR